MIFHLYIFACSVIAFVYSEILTSHGHIFNKLHNFLVAKLPDAISKPIIGCCLCVSGQISLWVYLYYYIDTYSFFMHVYFISLSILITWLLSNLKNKISN